MDENQKTDTPEVSPVTSSEKVTQTRGAVWYVLVGAAVIAVVIVLWFFLEKNGKISTTVFSSLTAMVEKSQPVALVSGVEIDRVDFDSNLKQLTANASQSGADVTSEAIVKDLRTQAIESLVNTEVLRQEAVKAEFTSTPEQVEERYRQIETQLGGAEGLASRMVELGVTNEMIRRDIANDIIIQALLEKSVDRTGVKVEEAELKALYDQAGGEAAGLPPFEEVRPQVEQQVRMQKEQALVGEYVNKVREGYEIEVLI